MRHSNLIRRIKLYTINEDFFLPPLKTNNRNLRAIFSLFGFSFFVPFSRVSVTRFFHVKLLLLLWPNENEIENNSTSQGYTEWKEKICFMDFVSSWITIANVMNGMATLQLKCIVKLKNDWTVMLNGISAVNMNYETELDLNFSSWSETALKWNRSRKIVAYYAFR